MIRGLLLVVTGIRAIVGLVVATFNTLVFSTLVFISGLSGYQKVATQLIHFWANTVFTLFGIEVATKGEKYLPTEGGAILVFNHQSHFDIPALCVSTRKEIRFGAKVELFSIPVWGQAMRAIGTLPIARDNRAEVMRIYADAAKRFKENALFVLAPEGTRQKEPVIGRFKKGPFVFATNAGVPIIPVVIKGAHDVLPKKSIMINVGKWKRRIYIQYLPPIDTKGYNVRDIEPLVQATREQMVKAYAEMPS